MKKDNIFQSRRHFIELAAAGSMAVSISPFINSKAFAEDKTPPKPATNVKDSFKVPRNENSMPGKYPGKVIQVIHDKPIVDNKFDYSTINFMLEKGMLALTETASIKDAWSKFVSPADIIGLKVNPVAGKELSTSLEIIRAIISQLEQLGVSRNNIVIWDRREFQLTEIGCTTENFPGIKIIGTERQDDKGSFYDSEGKMYGEEMIDKDWFYWADVEGKYDKESMPYMINEGKHSYFSRICTKDVTKIINIPILKNAGQTVTLCLKNLAYGVISNTGRLHKDLWAETCAEVCNFSPIRDKVVLNIVDGIKGCYNGGPGANPQFFHNFNSILLGTDPVAVDRIGHEIILKKRIEEKIQTEDNEKSRKFINLASDLGLGISDISKIKLEKINLT
jgi:hypothetical protein